MFWFLFFPHEVNQGYHTFEDLVITKVNGKKINNLNEMVEVIETDDSGNIIEFETFDHTYIILDREMAEKSNKLILSEYNISL